MSPRTRRLLVSIHLYLGLALAPYVLLYGVSTWLLNRDGPAPERIPMRWSTELDVALPAPDGSARGDRVLAARVRDALGLFGRLPPWKIEATPEGGLRFDVNRPGRSYRVLYEPSPPRARVEERATGLGTLLKSLHGLNDLPNSRWAQSWTLYTELSMWGLLALAASGVWLDGRRILRSSRARAGLVAGALSTLGFVLWLAGP